MNEPQVRKPNVKRAVSRRPRTSAYKRPPLPPAVITPQMIEQLELLVQRAAPTPPPAVAEKPLGQAIVEVIFDVGVDVVKKKWKETDPDSYALNRLAFVLAPHWPAENMWMLNLVALLTTGYGVIQVAERLKRDNQKSH